MMARLWLREVCVRPEGAAPGAVFSLVSAVQALEGFCRPRRTLMVC